MNIIHRLQTAASLIDEIPGVYLPQSDLESDITRMAMRTVLSAAAMLAVLTVIALLFSERIPKLKMPLFVLMVLAMAGSSLTLISSTIYLNTKADSGGPAHWHADIEFWACGNEFELRDPTGALSNKIGTAVLHEHDDHRIHLEGVVVDEEIDASLGKFMHVIGGAITDEALVVPLNAEGAGGVFEDETDGDGVAAPNPGQLDQYIVDDPELGRIANLRDGDTCNGEPAEVQTFVYTYDEDAKTYQQTKIDNPRDYVITDDPNVPPGDCIIVEFGPSRQQTDRLCQQYGIRDVDRCADFGVDAAKSEICEAHQLNYDPELTKPVTVTDDDENPAAASDLHICAPFFDEFGEPTGVEIAVYKDRGTLLNPETDCIDYQNSIKNSPQTETTEVQ